MASSVKNQGSRRARPDGTKPRWRRRILKITEWQATWILGDICEQMVSREFPSIYKRKQRSLGAGVGSRERQGTGAIFPFRRARRSSGGSEAASALREDSETLLATSDPVNERL